MWFNITEEEHKKIMKERSIAAEKALLKAKQKNCSHKNSYEWGKGGHNNDTWYRCRDCGFEWDE